MDVAAPGGNVLLADLFQKLGAIGHDLEQPGASRRCGVLGGEEEGEQGHGDLKVSEVANEHRRLLRIRHLYACIDPLAVRTGLDHGSDPEIEDTVSLAARSQTDLALRGTLGEFVQDHIRALLAIPALGEREDNGEVDELERGRDQVVVVANLLDRLLGHVVANKGAAAESALQLTEFGHELHRLALVVLLRDAHESLEILVVDLLLNREVLLERVAGEETIETLAIVDVGAAVKEDPVLRAEQLVRSIDDAGLDECGRVEDLAGHVAGRRNDDEPSPSVSTRGLSGGCGAGLY